MNKVSALNSSYIRTIGIPISRPLVLKWKFSLKIIWILFSALIIFLLVLCIFQVNAMVSALYSLQNYEKKINELTNENQNLAINSVQINSLENIGTLVKSLNFEKVDKIHYIQVLESQVVSK